MPVHPKGGVERDRAPPAVDDLKVHPRSLGEPSNSLGEPSSSPDSRENGTPAAPAAAAGRRANAGFGDAPAATRGRRPAEPPSTSTSGVPPVIDVMTRLKIHHMSQGGTKQAAIAEKVGVSLRSVERILEKDAPTIEDVDDRGRRGRPSIDREADRAEAEGQRRGRREDPHAAARSEEPAHDGHRGPAAQPQVGLRGRPEPDDEARRAAPAPNAATPGDHRPDEGLGGLVGDDLDVHEPGELQATDEELHAHDPGRHLDLALAEGVDEGVGDEGPDLVVFTPPHELGWVHVATFSGAR